MASQPWLKFQTPTGGSGGDSGGSKPWLKFRKQQPVATGPGTGVEHVNPATGNAVPEFVPRDKSGQPIAGYNPATGNVDRMGRVATAAASMPEGVPIIGPQLDKAAMAASAGIGSMISGDPYAKVRRQMENMKRVGIEENPISHEVGKAIGATAPFVGAGFSQLGRYGLGMQAPAVLGRVGGALYKPAASALSGAAIFGADTAARGGSQQEILDSMKENALWGGGLSAGGSLLGGTGRALFGRGAPRIPAGTRQGMADQASQFYRQMRASGVRVREPVAGRLVLNIARDLQGTNNRLSPTAYNLRNWAAQRLATAGGAGIDELHNFSKTVNRTLRSQMSGEDRHFVQQIKDRVEETLDNLHATDLAGGHPTHAIEMWRQADRLWGQQKKMEVIDSILDVADVNTGQYTQSQLANTIRKGMAALYKKIQKNPGARRGWTQEEIALVRQMARGGDTGAVINLFAKFAPRGVVSVLSGGAIGSAVGGPIGAGLLMGAGWAADRFKQSRMTNLAEGLRGTIARGP